MKVGLFVNTQFPAGFNLAERVPEMVAQVRAAREAGFASLWFPHHWLTLERTRLRSTSKSAAKRPIRGGGSPEENSRINPMHRIARLPNRPQYRTKWDRPPVSKPGTFMLVNI